VNPPRYAGCSTYLEHGRSMEGFMGVQLLHLYVLRPEQRKPSGGRMLIRWPLGVEYKGSRASGMSSCPRGFRNFPL
jgi:hypothetical protein